MTHTGEIRKVLIITLLLNIIAAIIKVSYGYLYGINSMLADGFHSFFDGTSNIIGLTGIYLAARPADTGHHYGHKKIETMATIAIALLLFLTCFEILEGAARNLRNPRPQGVSGTAFAVIGMTTCINVFVASYEYRKGRVLGSDFLTADAKHTVSDILASLVVVAGLIAVKTGYQSADSIAAILIALMIGHLGYSIIMEASLVLTDASPLIGEDIVRVKNIACGVFGVDECHRIRVRGRSDAVHIDCHILVSPEMKIQDAHDIAERVEERLKTEMPNVVDVVIHLEPHEERDKGD